MPILSSRVRTILALSPGSGFSSSLGSMLTLEDPFACCSGCLFSSDSLRSLASSKAAMSSEVIAIAVGFRRSILAVERYCNGSKGELDDDCINLARSPEEGGASRDCNSSFNLSASNSIESPYQKRSRDTPWTIWFYSEDNMFRPQVRQISLHCERAKFGLSTSARQFSCTRTVAAEDQPQPSGRYIQERIDQDKRGCAIVLWNLIWKFEF